MIVYTHAQGSPEWHAARAGVTTASVFKTAVSRLKSGANKGELTEAAKNEAFRIAVERISEKPLDEGIETYWTRRGHELEPVALQKYEIECGEIVDRCGFIATDDRKFGASADGLVGDDGGCEVKCFTDSSKLRAILCGDDTSEVIHQCMGGMWITGRKWWDLLLYCPALESIGLDLHVIRIKRDDDAINEMETALMEFDSMVEQYRADLIFKAAQR